MNNPTMLYKHPGRFEVDGDTFDYLIVDSSDGVEFNKALGEGWSKTPAEAKALTVKLVAEEKPKRK